MQEQIRDTVLGIYDAVADEALWPEILQRFAEQVNAKGCIVFEQQGLPFERDMTVAMASGNYDPKAIEAYLDNYLYYEARDHEIFEAHSLQTDGIDLIEDDVIAPTLHELRERPNVKLLRKWGILHRAAGLLNKDNTAVSRFSLQLGVQRGRLTVEERAYLALTLPHIAKALDLGRPAKQLALEHQSLLAALDRLTIGVCILDPKGGIVQANEEFKRQQDSHRTFAVARGGELRLAKTEDQKRFATLKADALNHGKFGARPRKEAVSTGRSSYLCIEVVPLNRSEEMGSSIFGGYILYSVDTSLPIPCNTLPIKYAYGLTDAELSLVDAIGEGLTNAQIAERRNRSPATINAQVKSILSKTHCATRTQFVRLMMSFGANCVSGAGK